MPKYQVWRYQPKATLNLILNSDQHQQHSRFLNIQENMSLKTICICKKNRQTALITNNQPRNIVDYGANSTFENKQANIVAYGTDSRTTIIFDQTRQTNLDPTLLPYAKFRPVSNTKIKNGAAHCQP